MRTSGTPASASNGRVGATGSASRRCRLFVSVSHGEGSRLFLSEHTGDARPDTLLVPLGRATWRRVAAGVRASSPSTAGRSDGVRRDRAGGPGLGTACGSGRAVPARQLRKGSYRSLDSLQRDNRRCRACAEAGLRSSPAPWCTATASSPTSSGRRRHRRRRGAPAVARARGAHAAPLARARRGRLLRGVLLRGRDALLSRARRVRPRRPDADAAGAGAVRVLARVGAPDRAAAADRDRRRHRGAPPARCDEPRRPSAGASNWAAPSRAAPHPSGASSWLNDPANRERTAAAAALVREVGRLGPGRAGHRG